MQHQRATGKGLNLYLVTNNDMKEVDPDHHYDAFVICCDGEETARQTYPGEPCGHWNGHCTFVEVLKNPNPRTKQWIQPEDVKKLTVVWIGVAVAGVEKGCICESFMDG